MNAINQVRVKTRIILLVLIPLIATLILAIERYQHANDEVTNIERLEVLQQYIAKVSPLVEGVQQERMYTKMYLGPGSSKSEIGLEFEQRMSDSRPIVDKALANYLEFVQQQKRLNEFPALIKDIQAVQEQVKLLPLVRSNADKRLKKIKNTTKATGKYIWTVLSFKNITEKLLDSAKQVVLLSSKNPELSLLANAYQNLIYAKNTSTSQTDAMYTAISGTLSVNVTADIIRLAAMEKVYLKNFASFAPSDTKSFFNTNLAQLPAYKYSATQAENIRRKAKVLVNNKIDIDKNDWLDKGKDISTAYNKVIKHVLAEIEDTKNRLMEEGQSVVNNTIILILVLLLIIIAISSKIVASINSPLKQLMTDLTNLAHSKDMTLRSNIEGKNELSSVGNAFNSLIDTFEKTLLKVRGEIVSMDETTHKVSSSMHESMKLIDNQKEATDSISVAINEMTSTIYEVSTMSTSTSETVQRAYNLSISSESEAKTSKVSMDELFEELGQTSKLVSDLNNEANQISNVVQVIKGISEQTNLLALNAAIEAARAGEMGRGFAVVADEVRNLSKRTHDSTDQIQAQIETLINGAAAASKKMENLQSNGVQALGTVEKSTKAFTTIKAELDQITEMASQIAVAAEQQTNVAEEINERIHLIKDDSDTMYKQGAETLSSTESLLKNGSALKDNIGVFHF